MRIHTTLSEEQLQAALRRAQDAGRVGGSVKTVVLSEHGSHTHPHAFEVQLGSHEYERLPEGYTNQYGKRQKTRRRNNPNTAWAATWHEWGWFLAELFAMDPDAVVGNPRARHSAWGYDGVDDFNDQTKEAFLLTVAA